MPGRARAAAAGALAAAAWGALEPLDQRLFRCDYSDVALLGKTFTRGPAWRPLGFALHAMNGAIFGLAFHETRHRLPIESRRLALAMALLEHATLYPLGYFVDRYHPARGEPGIPPLLRNPRAFGQATVRHALFGLLLGRLAHVPSRSDRKRCGRRPHRAAGKRFWGRREFPPTQADVPRRGR